MNRNRFHVKFFFLTVSLSFTFFSTIQANDLHKVEKRQIGVLARTGALPQGKRSVEVLARNGELPPFTGKKLSADQTLDQLIEELESAENLSRLRVEALAEKLSGEKGPETEKRSVAALARNGELPQKRLADFGSRTGYLIKPPQETARPPRDLLDSDDFLGTAKRTQILGRNFLLWRKNVRPQSDPYISRSFSLERNGGYYTGPLLKSQDWIDGFDSDDFHDDVKKNVGATKNFGKREIRGNCLGDFEKARGSSYPLWQVRAAKIKSKGSGLKSKRSAYLGQIEDEDGGAFPLEADADEETVEKRFLGRIPQLGRIHQKVQTPSMRRRPHLRPNWL